LLDTRKKIDGVCNGWGLKTSDMRDYSQNILDEFRNVLGPDVFEAKFGGKPLSLGALANWLVALPHENVANLVHRVDTPRHAIHHSTVVLNKEPSEEALNEYLFHLRRAFGQKNRPPANSAGVLGRVLVWRRNKYIGVSREGTVSMSWPIPGNDETYAFEVNYWHKKFQGLFLILALHVHGEKVVFEELSDLAATQAENLSIDSNFEQMQRQRNRLRNLASVMTRYTVSMSSSDCGGTTEYSEFFISLREVYGIPELRDELSTELKDVLAVVESNYLEEEKNQRDIEEEQRRLKNEIAARINKEKSAHRQRFEIILSVFGSITLPFVVVGGIWGMNLSNLPDINFWWVLLFCFIISLLILIVLIALLMVRNWNFFKLKKGSDVRYEGLDDDDA
jgi:glutaredoxin